MVSFYARSRNSKGIDGRLNLSVISLKYRYRYFEAVCSFIFGSVVQVYLVENRLNEYVEEEGVEVYFR